jgi:prevent-host-death family protein
MTTVTLEEAQAKLPEIIRQMIPGEELVITDHGEPLAQVTKTERKS